MDTGTERYDDKSSVSSVRKVADLNSQEKWKLHSKVRLAPGEEAEGPESLFGMFYFEAEDLFYRLKLD